MVTKERSAYFFNQRKIPALEEADERTLEKINGNKKKRKDKKIPLLESGIKIAGKKT